MVKKRFNCPNLGFGIGYREPYTEALLSDDSGVDWLEVISETYLLDGGAVHDRLAALKERYQIVPHGVSLGLGAADPVDWDYLTRLKKLVDFLDPPWVSDHLCWSQFGGAHLHNLLPMVYTQETAAFIAAKIRLVQAFLGRPLLIENVSSYIEFSASDLTEWDFLSAVTESADCGILLDINNVYVSSRNHGFDPNQYINNIPLGRVVQVHIAGHDDRGTYVLDTHDQPIREQVWALYERTLPRLGAVSVMIERDDQFPPYPELMAELQEARVRYQRGWAATITPPQSLTALQSWMTDAIRYPERLNDDPRVSMAIRPSETLTPQERLQIYIEDYWPRCLDSLRDDFPLLLAHWGRDQFDRQMTQYVLDCPSRSFTLFHLPQDLLEYLDQTYQAPDREIVCRIAAYEWAKARAYFVKKESDFEPDGTVAIGPDTVLRFQPDVAWGASWDDQDPWVVWREETVVLEDRISSVLVDLLSALKDGATLTDAVSLCFDRWDDPQRQLASQSMQDWFSMMVQRQWVLRS